MPDRPRRVTLRDIASETGLSTATVSYALRGLQVPTETQQRVRSVAERLGYQVDPIARALASGRTGYVGLLCSSLTDGWRQDLAAALGRSLSSRGSHALIVDACEQPDLEEQLASRLVEQRVDALVVMPVDAGAEHWQRIAARAVLVSVGDSLSQVRPEAEIRLDNTVAIQEGLTLFQRQGHRRVAVLASRGPCAPRRPAEAAAADIARRLGIRVDVRATGTDLDDAATAAADLLRSPEPPTAFLCLADSVAYGVYVAAREMGLVVPDQISVVGCDDRQTSGLLTPPLSSFRWPFDRIVREVVNRTVRAVETGHGGSVTLRPRLVRRGSVAPDGG